MADSAKLLMSPLDFQRVAGSEGSDAKVNKGATPAKRMLFAKKNKEGSFFCSNLNLDIRYHVRSIVL